jgi:DNA-directed RNA polymerase specialized sigma24 family protein
MLDIDTLNALYDLSAYTLYSAELARLPKLSRKEQEEVIARARAGDQHARQAFLESCLSYAFGQAYHFAVTRGIVHDEPLDLAQEASLVMIAALDRALAINNPAAYMRGIARSAIARYCFYRAGLIQRPESGSTAVLKRQHPATLEVESLDTLIYGKRIRADLISAPEPQSEPDEGHQRARYAILYQGLKRLGRKQRSTIIQLYGLYGQPKRTAREIGQPGAVFALASQARKRLREHLAQMLVSKPQEEEEA